MDRSILATRMAARKHSGPGKAAFRNKWADHRALTLLPGIKLSKTWLTGSIFLVGCFVVVIIVVIVF